MVDAMRFDFSKEIGVTDGTTYLYYDHDTKKINEVMHYYVNYTNDSDPKTELQNAVGNIQTNISALLGNPSEPFMLMNTSGEFKDYDGLNSFTSIEPLTESVSSTCWLSSSCFSCASLTSSQRFLPTAFVGRIKSGSTISPTIASRQSV